MNLLSGLEKFGLDVSEDMDIFEEDKPKTGTGTEAVEKKSDIPTEDMFLLEKGIRCPVCDKVFKTKMIKNGRVKRLESDKDLRPRHQYIDTLKYDICSWPALRIYGNDPFLSAYHQCTEQIDQRKHLLKVPCTD